jgi:DNA invertase Pin-like site-specific DNA recombinase
MVFTVLGAVAELERSRIVERVRAGLRNAGTKVGFFENFHDLPEFLITEQAVVKVLVLGHPASACVRLRQHLA